MTDFEIKRLIESIDSKLKKAEELTDAIDARLTANKQKAA
ncbi:hypothetical protein GCM10007171_21530 [Dickeya fangzhongdai]|nr:hypothetical protein GCM10007171_21530 [Dickeya fangzhongdai]